MLNTVNRGDQIAMIDRVRYRYQAALVLDRMNKAVDTLFDVAGGRSVFQGAPIQEVRNDIHIARAHIANNPIGFARNFGNMLLGQATQDEFI